MGILGYPLNGILTTKKQWWIPPFRSFSIFSARYTKSVENRVGATRLVILGFGETKFFWRDGWHLTCFKPNDCKYFQPDGVGSKYLLLFLYTPLKILMIGVPLKFQLKHSIQRFLQRQGTKELWHSSYVYSKIWYTVVVKHSLGQVENTHFSYILAWRGYLKFIKERDINQHAVKVGIFLAALDRVLRCFCNTRTRLHWGSSHCGIFVLARRMIV